MSDLRAVIQVRSLTARCPLDPCFIKLILKQSQFDQPVDYAKLESKKQLVLRNGYVDINEIFELPVQTSFLRDNKVHLRQMQITIIVMVSKGKQISLLGIANIDFKKINPSQYQTVLQLPLQKCTDTKAELNACVHFLETHTQSEQTFDFDRNGPIIYPPQMTHRSMPSTVTTVLNSSHSDAVCNSKKYTEPAQVASSKLRAIEISRRNFKHYQIDRDDKKSTSRDTSGSYKKRFEYQQKLDSHKHQGRTSNIKMFGRRKPSEREPIVREKTPEPIKFQSTNRKSSPPKPNMRQDLYNNAYESKPKRQQVKQLSGRKNNNTAEQEQRRNRVRFAPSIEAGHIVSNRSHKHNRSCSNQRDGYIHLAEKLEKIQQQIQRQQTSIDAHNNSKRQMDMALSPTSVCTFGETEEWKTTNHNPKEFGSSYKNSEDVAKQFERERLEMQQMISIESRRVKQLQDEKAQNQLLIEKLTKLYQDCQEKLLHQNSESQALRRQQIESYESQINRLNRELSKVNKENQELRMQLANKKSSDVENELKNEKRKVINLSSEIKFKENELKFVKLSEQALKTEKKQLEQQIRKLSIQQPIVRKESKAESDSQLMNSAYSSTLRAENKMLKDQIQLLQKRNTQLNGIIEQKQKLVLSSSKCMEHQQIIKNKSAEIRSLKEINRLLEQKCNVISENNKIIESDLITTKNNFAEAMNVAFEKGGSELVDLLESKMTFHEDQQ